MTRSRPPRGTCPECGQSVPLYRGVLRSHQVRATLTERALSGRPAATCPGGTREPGTYSAPGQLALDTGGTA